MHALAAIVAVVLVSPIVALAQDPPPAPRRTQLTLDIGFVDAAGNSDVTSFNLGEKLTWRPGRVVLSQTARALYGATDGTTTTESYDAGARAEYPLTGTIGAFALLTYQRDPFAGVAMRLGGGPGVSIGLVRSARDTLSVETALTTQKERSTADVEQSFAATRTAAVFKHLFTTTTLLTQTLEWTANLETSDDQRLNSETAVTAPLSRQIAVRVSYLIRHDNLPEPGFEKTDRILTTGVQIAF